MGEEFTARNFRTWAASALAFELLHENPDIGLGEVLAEVADRLGNTPAITHKSYVHPAVIAAAKNEQDAAPLPRSLPRRTHWLSRSERGLLEFLKGLPKTK
jgi:DNA topoisomerase-1